MKRWAESSKEGTVSVTESTIVESLRKARAITSGKDKVGYT